MQICVSELIEVARSAPVAGSVLSRKVMSDLGTTELAFDELRQCIEAGLLSDG
jgi:hypothetical protein